MLPCRNSQPYFVLQNCRKSLGIPMGVGGFCHDGRGSLVVGSAPLVWAPEPPPADRGRRPRVGFAATRHTPHATPTTPSRSREGARQGWGGTCRGTSCRTSSSRRSPRMERTATRGRGWARSSGRRGPRSASSTCSWRIVCGTAW